jgi:uncharacterized membrane protein
LRRGSSSQNTLRTDLIKWIVGAALSSVVAAATAITAIASRVSWSKSLALDAATSSSSRSPSSAEQRQRTFH